MRQTLDQGKDMVEKIDRFVYSLGRVRAKSSDCNLSGHHLFLEALTLSERI